MAIWLLECSRASHEPVSGQHEPRLAQSDLPAVRVPILAVSANRPCFLFFEIGSWNGYSDSQKTRDGVS